MCFPTCSEKSSHKQSQRDYWQRGNIYYCTHARKNINTFGRETCWDWSSSLYQAVESAPMCGALCLFHATSASVSSPVWLERDAVITCHLTQVLLQLSEKLLVAFSLIQRHEGVNVGKLPPGNGLREERTAEKRWLFSNHMTGSHFWLGEYILWELGESIWSGVINLWPLGQNWQLRGF